MLAHSVYQHPVVYALYADEYRPGSGTGAPLLARGGHDVHVAVEEEGRSSVRAGEPRHEVRTLGIARVELAFDPRGGEESPHMFDARTLRSWGVRRVEAEEVAQQLDRIGRCSNLVSSSRSPKRQCAI